MTDAPAWDFNPTYPPPTTGHHAALAAQQQSANPPPVAYREQDVVDLGEGHEPIPFRLFGQMIFSAPAVPLAVYQELTAISEKMREMDMGAVLDFMDKVMLDESMPVLRKHWGDKRQPLELSQLQTIIETMVERFGARPTQPPSASSDPSPAGGNGNASTPGAQPVPGLIPAHSPQSGS